MQPQNHLLNNNENCIFYYFLEIISLKAINNNEIFVSEIIEANYNTNNQISIGSTLSTYNFNITKYSPSTALDSEDFSIINIENEPGGQQIVEDPIWGYKAQSEGIAKVTIAMDNNPSVTYTIEITVVR